MIEFDCAKITITKSKDEIKIDFTGTDELEFMIFKREFNSEFMAEFYTYSNYDEETYWSYIKVTVNEKAIVFSVNKTIKINLFISPTKYKQLLTALRTMIESIGRLTITEVEKP
ncbi:MAG: hypothetical protein H7296_11150 [Bacteroidia bacterium]|nr:hypothetical protein [Bacteroidia bacterium]